MFAAQQSRCFQCKSATLAVRFVFSIQGVPHGLSKHNTGYVTDCFSVCSSCGHGLLEHHSHDCWSHDDPWDMTWWSLLDPASAQVISQWAAVCPNPTKPRCSCAAHAQENPLKSLSWSPAYRTGAQKLAGRAVARLEGGQLRISREPGQVEMHPLPVHEPPPGGPLPAREVRYYLAGLRPLKRLITASGQLVVLKMSWETGAFEYGLEYEHNIQRDHETEEIDEATFLAHVEGHRATLALPDSPLRALYLVLAALPPDDEVARALRPRTYALFQETWPDPYYP